MLLWYQWRWSDGVQRNLSNINIQHPTYHRRFEKACAAPEFGSVKRGGVEKDIYPHLTITSFFPLSFHFDYVLFFSLYSIIHTKLQCQIHFNQSIVHHLINVWKLNWNAAHLHTQPSTRRIGQDHKMLPIYWFMQSKEEAVAYQYNEFYNISNWRSISLL